MGLNPQGNLQSMALLNEIFCVQIQKRVYLSASTIMDKLLKFLWAHTTLHTLAADPQVLQHSKNMHTVNYCCQEASVVKLGKVVTWA